MHVRILILVPSTSTVTSNGKDSAGAAMQDNLLARPFLR